MSMIANLSAKFGSQGSAVHRSWCGSTMPLGVNIRAGEGPVFSLAAH
jgi:hypothetical protein